MKVHCPVCGYEHTADPADLRAAGHGGYWCEGGADDRHEPTMMVTMPSTPGEWDAALSAWTGHSR